MHLQSKPTLKYIFVKLIACHNFVVKDNPYNNDNKI